jgi:hypothetical protein
MYGVSIGTSVVIDYERTSESNLWIVSNFQQQKDEPLATNWSPVPSKHNIKVRAGCSEGITAGNPDGIPVLALAKVEFCGLPVTVAVSLSTEAALVSWT